MSQTATPEAARAHARAQAATVHLGPGDDPRHRRRRSARGRRSGHRDLGRDHRSGRRGGAGPRARHPGPPHRPARRRLRQPARLSRASPDRAPQRRRHREGAVAGVPRCGVVAALRHGPGAAVDQRRLGRRPRRVVRCVELGAQRREVRERRCARVRFPTPATGSRSRWRSSGSTVATSCRTSTSSSTCASTTTARLRFDGTRSSPGAYVELLAELPVVLAVANTPHVLDPRDEYSVTELRITAWTDTPTTRADPLWSSSPEAERAFLNTEDLAALGSRASGTTGDDGRDRSSTRSWRRVRPGPASWSAARRCRSSTSAATRPSTACSTTPTTRPSATARPTPSSSRATSSSSPAAGSSRTRAAR